MLRARCHLNTVSAKDVGLGFLYCDAALKASGLKRAARVLSSNRSKLKAVSTIALLASSVDNSPKVNTFVVGTDGKACGEAVEDDGDGNGDDADEVAVGSEALDEDPGDCEGDDDADDEGPTEDDEVADDEMSLSSRGS